MFKRRDGADAFSSKDAPPAQTGKVAQKRNKGHISLSLLPDPSAPMSVWRGRRDFKLPLGRQYPVLASLVQGSAVSDARDDTPGLWPGACGAVPWSRWWHWGSIAAEN